jgi:hypothetical protein
VSDDLRVEHGRQDADLVEAIAERVVELLDEHRVAPASWLDAEAVARLLGVERDYVYANASRLGARRLGDGPRARLRFRLEDVEAAIPCLSGRESGEAETRTATPKPTRRRRRRLGTGTLLLPIRGPGVRESASIATRDA